MNTRIRLNFLLRMKILDCYSILSMKYFFFLNLSVRYTQPRSILSKLGYLILPAKFLFIFITRLSRYLFNSIRIIPNFILVQFHFQQNRVPFEEYKPKKSSPNNYLNNNRDEQSPFRTPFFVHVCWCSRFLFHSIPGKTSSLCIYTYIYIYMRGEEKKKRGEEREREHNAAGRVRYVSPIWHSCVRQKSSLPPWAIFLPSTRSRPEEVWLDQPLPFAPPR